MLKFSRCCQAKQRGAEKNYRVEDEINLSGGQLCIFYWTFSYIFPTPFDEMALSSYNIKLSNSLFEMKIYQIVCVRGEGNTCPGSARCSQKNKVKVYSPKPGNICLREEGVWQVILFQNYFQQLLEGYYPAECL